VLPLPWRSSTPSAGRCIPLPPLTPENPRSLLPKLTAERPSRQHLFAGRTEPLRGVGRHPPFPRPMEWVSASGWTTQPVPRSRPRTGRSRVVSKAGWCPPPGRPSEKE
jgi:hypothetical protein